MVEMRFSFSLGLRKKCVFALLVFLSAWFQVGCKTSPVKEAPALETEMPASAVTETGPDKKQHLGVFPAQVEPSSLSECQSPRAQAIKDTRKVLNRSETGLAFFTDIALPLNPMDYQRLNRMGVLIVEAHWKRQVPMQWGRRDGFVLVQPGKEQAPYQLSCRELLIEDGVKDLVKSNDQSTLPSLKSKAKLPKQLKSGKNQFACFFPYSSIFDDGKILYRDLFLRKSIPIHSFKGANLKPPSEEVKTLAPDPRSKVDATTALTVIRRRECQVAVSWK